MLPSRHVSPLFYIISNRASNPIYTAELMTDDKPLRPASKKLTEETVDNLAARMRGLPELPKKDRVLSKVDAVRRLAKEIRGLRDRGYSMEQIAELLSEGGVQVTPRALGSYMTRVAPIRKNKKKQSAAAPPPKLNVSKPGDTPPAQPQASAAGKGSFTPRPDTQDI
jgi:hypothetical protein